MRYSGIQPQYFPRLHYFARILNADLFMLRDDCQFVRQHKYPNGKNGKSYQAHTPIKQQSGVRLLPISLKHEGVTPIFQTRVSYKDDWVQDHLQTIKVNYKTSPNFLQIFPEIQSILSIRYENLAELNIATISWALKHIMGYTRLKKIVRATETKVFADIDSMTASEKIVALCKEVGATENYCGGTAMAAYINKDLFRMNGITITVQNWECREYKQRHIEQLGFIPNLSILDLLMNTSDRDAIKILQG